MGKAERLLDFDAPKTPRLSRKKSRELTEKTRRAVRRDAKRLLTPFFRRVQEQRGLPLCRCSKDRFCPRHTPIKA